MNPKTWLSLHSDGRWHECVEAMCRHCWQFYSTKRTLFIISMFLLVSQQVRCTVIMFCSICGMLFFRKGRITFILATPTWQHTGSFNTTFWARHQVQRPTMTIFHISRLLRLFFSRHRGNPRKCDEQLFVIQTERSSRNGFFNISDVGQGMCLQKRTTSKIKYRTYKCCSFLFIA